MADYVAYCSNFLALVNTLDRCCEGYSDNRFAVSIEKYTVEIIQTAEVLTNTPAYFQNRFSVTTMLIVRDVTQSVLKQVRRVCESLTSLMSFMSMSVVSIVKEEYPPGNVISTWPVQGYACYYKPVIEIRDRSKVIAFIQSTWTQYKKLHKKRKLLEVFQYLAISEFPHQPIESKLVLLLIAIESLKSTYADYIGIPFAAGAYREVSTPPKSNPKKEPKISFEEVLRRMLRSAKMSRGLKRIVSLRNDLVHRGVLRTKFPVKVNRYSRMQDIVREYILRLLGYKGEYIKYVDNEGTDIIE